VVRVYIGVQDISERKRIEVALAEERNRLRTLIDALPDYIYVKDAQSRFIMLNKAALASTGMAHSEIVGKTDFDIFPAEFAQPFYDDEQRVITSGKSLVNKVEPSIEPLTGERIWFLTSKVPLYDEHGNVTSLIGISRNITERKRIEEALRESEERYRFLFNQIADAIFIHDENAQILEVNAAACANLGYSREELLRMKTTDIDDSEYRQGFKERLSLQLEQGSLHDIEGVHIARDGRRISILVNSRKIIYQGRMAVLAVARDITERKQVENLFRTLLESAPDAMIIADTEGHITLINTQAEKLFGYSKTELVGRTVEILMPENFRADHNHHRHDYVQMARTRAMGSGQDLYAMRKDGTPFPVEISLSPIETDGKMLVASAIRDISLHKKAEQELQDARIRAEEASKLKSEFLATMSHELRTPLNAIIGFSDAMLNNLTGDMSDVQRGYMEIILNNGEHLLSIINNLLDVSKIEAGQFELRNIQVDLRTLLDQMRGGFQSLTDEKGLRLVTFLDPTMPRLIIGDELRLKQILINLVGNAIKFTDVGQVEVHIMKGEDCWWIISVSDTGIGIPAEAMGYVFEQFRQVDNSSTRQYEGTGLGLAIVQRLIHLMGGTVSVESEINKGSTFTIRLPLIT
jgi:PAS domain S-box-containing protein